MEEKRCYLSLTLLTRDEMELMALARLMRGGSESPFTVRLPGHLYRGGQDALKVKIRGPSQEEKTKSTRGDVM